MSIESSVTSVSWIPSEAVTGVTKGFFEVGVTHYDDTPPDAIGPDIGATLEELRAADRFRFANHLAAWAEFADDRSVVAAGYRGGGRIGSTTIRLGKEVTAAAVSLPDRQLEPLKGPGWVRFTQTAGGRTAFPAPRPVRRPPFVQFASPIAWSTLELTIYADGRSEGQLVGASTFPRHWVYDDEGLLVTKSGLIDYKDWAGHAFGKHTPWGDEDSPAFVSAVETALERQLSAVMMHGAAKPEIRKLKAGKTLTQQGASDGELFLLLDGVLVVEVDGSEVAEVGPGAVVGERALLEGGIRTSTLRAHTACRVAAVPFDSVDRDLLLALSGGHRREEQLHRG
jgi:Cyclic nucleotide-binding domain